ncbi:DNA-3-methyladenine glycosylase II [Scopulibacillus daqui]|uniref:DNA-3-methyladenine glycosylase II n=1 Tax=Scopulibacillus daqui TaxID=1469162 RepID=A0ABS2PYY0_9BACL|nr:DNA-3-methyladenine glycosylase [Scopulibacillus daqui]MBM7645176.1 DNA-3-methyladenine glycosylase II [Scopulibacillus daqui]
MWQRMMNIEGPYDFDRALRRLAFDPLIHIDLNKRLIKMPLWIDNEPIVASVQALGTTDRPSFIISAQNREMEVAEQVTDIFKWDRSLYEVCRHFAKTDLAPVFNAFKGMPLVKDFGIYQSLVKCIIHQQLNLVFSYQLTERFVKQFGFSIDDVWFYPRPETVAEIPYESLQQLQFSRRKAEYLVDTSRIIADKSLSLDELKRMTDDEVIKKLVKIRGVGPWTAQNVLLFGLGRENLMPAGDIGIQNAIKKLYQLEQKPPLDFIESKAKSWSPFNSYAAIYLWEFLGNHIVKSSSQGTRKGLS